VTAFFAVIFGMTLIYACATSRIEAYIRALALQGFLLMLCVIFGRRGMPAASLIFLCVETLAFKTVIIPWFLMYTVRKNGILREDEPYLPNFYSVVLATAISAAGFYVSFLMLRSGAMPGVNALFFGAALSAVATGLFIIISRKKVITHVMGFVMMENGIFLLSLSFSGEMPFIVNLGVLLDLFIAVFLLGLFVSRINSTFEEQEVDMLSELKD
jgi:hydrogenase-4 component E